jgi:hypothetical protein
LPSPDDIQPLKTAPAVEAHTYRVREHSVVILMEQMKH